MANRFRNKAYDGGGEEHLTFHGTYCNVGGGLDIDTGIFTCPTGGIYLFQVVPQIDPSVPQPVVQSRRRPLLGPSPG